jgi:hypothetical protein
LFAKLFRKFTPVEEAVLQSVNSSMPALLRGRFSQQLLLINKVQRHSDDKEVNMYMMKAGQVSSPPVSSLLSSSDDEFKLGEVHLTAADGGLKMRADLWVVRGRIFSIEFEKSPGLLKGKFGISSCLITDNFEKSGDFPRVLQSELPEEYLELVRAGLDFQNGWHIFGTDGIYSVVQSDNNLWVIAEKISFGVLAFPWGSKQIYCFEFEGSKRKLDVPLTVFLESV